jgi:proliferating cell nuclear antigen
MTEETTSAPPTSSKCIEIYTVQAVAFKVLTEALKELLTDTCIDFDESGMKIIAMDTSHIVLVHLKLDASKFEIYNCQRKMVVGVNMLNLHKLVKTINNNDQLTLYIENDDINHLCIQIENTDKNCRTTYKLNLLDLDHQAITVDPSQFNEVITLPSTDFQKICRDMHNLAEFMEIKSFKNQIIFSCKGDFCSQETIMYDTDTDSMEADALLSNGKGGALPMDSAQTNIVQGIFSIKHMVLFTKCTNLCPTTEIYLKNDYPLIVKYDVSSLGSIRLALAPQVNK